MYCQYLNALLYISFLNITVAETITVLSELFLDNWNKTYKFFVSLATVSINYYNLIWLWCMLKPTICVNVVKCNVSETKCYILILPGLCYYIQKQPRSIPQTVLFPYTTQIQGCNSVIVFHYYFVRCKLSLLHCVLQTLYRVAEANSKLT